MAVFVYRDTACRGVQVWQSALFSLEIAPHLTTHSSGSCFESTSALLTQLAARVRSRRPLRKHQAGS